MHIKKFGKFKYIRTKVLKMSQEHLAQLIDVPTATVQDWESRESIPKKLAEFAVRNLIDNVESRRLPKHERLKKFIADQLKIDIDVARKRLDLTVEEFCDLLDIRRVEFMRWQVKAKPVPYFYQKMVRFLLAEKRKKQGKNFITEIRY